MKTSEQRVAELGHAFDASASVAERIATYRALAATTSSPALAAHFFNCADELVAAEQKIGQRMLSFDRAFGHEGNGGEA